LSSNSPYSPVSQTMTGTGALGVLAREVARLGRMVSNMRLVGPGSLTVFGDKIEIRTQVGPWASLAFAYSQDNADITIRAGNLRIHGSKNIAVPETTVTLTGTPEWIYVEHERTSDTASIQHATTEPETTPTLLRYPLYRFLFDTDLQAYRLADQGIKHVGDIQLDTPLRT